MTEDNVMGYKDLLTLNIIDNTGVDTSDNETEEEIAATGSSPIKRKRGRPSTKEKKYERNPTAYNMFVKETMPKVREEMPGLTNTQYMKECAKLWKTLRLNTTKKV